MKNQTKRKMYLKRRKKEKAEQRKVLKTQLPSQPETICCKKKYSNHKQYQRKLNKNVEPYNNHHDFVKPLNTYTRGLQIWWQTYCTAIQYHTDQQNILNNKNEHHPPSNRTNDNLTLLEIYAQEYETSSEEEDDEQQGFQLQVDSEDVHILGNMTNAYGQMATYVADDVDDEYLKFLEITHKHREELRLKKAEENL